MTMLSFRVDDAAAESARRWAADLGVDRSELLRGALARELERLAADRDAAIWAANPRDDAEAALDAVAAWAPAEDWSDWVGRPDPGRTDAAR